LSVLALIGWNGWGWSSLPSSVPAWVLPMVIVIVGVENMSTLVCFPDCMRRVELIRSDESCIFGPLSLFCTRTYRSRFEPKRSQDLVHLVDEYSGARHHLVLCRCRARSRILSVRHHCQHHRLVHVAYILPNGMSHCIDYACILMRRFCRLMLNV
jgi:hypothetical protein